MIHEMLNSADTSCLKAELKGSAAKWPLPQGLLASLLEVVSTSAEL